MQDETRPDESAYPKRMTFNPRFWHPAANLRKRVHGFIGFGCEAKRDPIGSAHHTSAVAPVTILIWTYLDR